MTNKKSTKKALISSALCLLLCMSMLIGTTFAWFTDSVSTTNNIITAGNLDVNLYWSTNGNDWAPVDANTNIFKTGTLWEPGHTEVVYLKVVNEGSLALKYDLIVNVASEIEGTNVAGDSFKLSDYILYNVYDGVKTYADSAAARGDETGNKLNAPYNKATALEAGKETVLTMAVFMPTTVGNEANYKKGTTAPSINLGINLFATQFTKEEDSYGPNYDKLAVVSSEADLRAAMQAGGNAILMSDIAVDGDTAITIPAGVNTVLDLNGKTISSVSNQTNSNRNTFDVRGTLTVKNGSITTKHVGNNMGWGNSTNVFNVTAGGVLNIQDATIINLGGSDMAFVAHLNNWGEVTLNVDNSTLVSSYTAVRVFNSGYDMNNVNITNSTLMGASQSFWVHNATIEDFGTQEKVDAAAACLNFNFIIDNPVNGVAADDVSNLVADANNTFVGKIRYGFTNGAVYFKSAEKVVANSSSAMNDAISNGATTVYLGSGDYVIPAAAKGKTLTIVGNGETNVAVTKVGTGGENCDYGLDGSTVVFENVTITTNSSTYIGYARCNGTYNNCTINGTYTLYGNSVFNNCTFNVSGDVYNIWTWGAPTAEFNNCTFNSDGKALLLYGQANTKLTVTGCTFNDNGGLTDLKAAIEIGNDYNKSYELIVNNTVVNGYEINDKGINTGSTLWANKNSMPQEKLNVVIDGVDVY